MVSSVSGFSPPPPHRQLPRRLAEGTVSRRSGLKAGFKGGRTWRSDPLCVETGGSVGGEFGTEQVLCEKTGTRIEGKIKGE